MDEKVLAKELRKHDAASGIHQTGLRARLVARSLLLYGRGSVHGNRVRHVLAHAVADPSTPMNSVFDGGRRAVLRTVDEARSSRAGYTVHPASGNWNYRAVMGREVGTLGERAINISVRPGTSETYHHFSSFLTSVNRRMMQCRATRSATESCALDVLKGGSCEFALSRITQCYTCAKSANRPGSAR